jgi:hypothetical protein
MVGACELDRVSEDAVLSPAVECLGCVWSRSGRLACVSPAMLPGRGARARCALTDQLIDERREGTLDEADALAGEERQCIDVGAPYAASASSAAAAPSSIAPATRLKAAAHARPYSGRHASPATSAIEPIRTSPTTA